MFDDWLFSQPKVKFLRSTGNIEDLQSLLVWDFAAFTFMIFSRPTNEKIRIVFEFGDVY